MPVASPNVCFFKNVILYCTVSEEEMSQKWTSTSYFIKRSASGSHRIAEDQNWNFCVVSLPFNFYFIKRTPCQSVPKCRQQGVFRLAIMVLGAHIHSKHKLDHGCFSFEPLFLKLVLTIKMNCCHR